MDTKEINLDYFKHQSIQLLAIIKQLSSIEDQYEAIIYILSAINAYLKNIFTYNDREILKTKIYSNPELVKGHVNDVLQAIKGDDCEKVEHDQEKNIVPKVNSVKNLLHFPYYIRSSPKNTSNCKVLYKITNRHLSARNLEDYTYKEIIRWTAGINQVNKLRSNLKVRVVVRKTLVPRPIKRSVSADTKPRKITASKISGRSQSTTVRPPNSTYTDSDTTNTEYVDSIDYDELILNPELETKLVQVKSQIAIKEPSNKSPKQRRLSKEFTSNKLNTSVGSNTSTTNLSVMGDLDDEKLDDLESDEDDDEPKASVSDPNAKKPAKKRKTYPCIFCKKSYRSRKSLMLHFQHHPGFCPDCGEQIGFSPQEIVEHNRLFHIKERPIICEECGESFTRNQQYQVHLQCHQKAKEKDEIIVTKHDCSECGLVFVNQKGLEKHIMESEHKQDKRLCEICGVDFDTNTRLMQHVRRVHRPKSFSCTHCSKQFTLKCNLDRHIKSLHSNNPSKLVCEHCGNEYTSQNSLNEHMEMAHKKSKIWKCNVCDKTFFIKRLLKVHEIVHSEYRPFQCPQCDQCYKRRSHLDRHIHFSHNKNGKVTRDSTQNLQNGEKVPKKKKTPEEIALKKALKAEVTHSLTSPVTSNPQQQQQQQQQQHQQQTGGIRCVAPSPGNLISSINNQPGSTNEIMNHLTNRGTSQHVTTQLSSLLNHPRAQFSGSNSNISGLNNSSGISPNNQQNFGSNRPIHQTTANNNSFMNAANGSASLPNASPNSLNEFDRILSNTYTGNGQSHLQNNQINQIIPSSFNNQSGMQHPPNIINNNLIQQNVITSRSMNVNQSIMTSTTIVDNSNITLSQSSPNTLNLTTIETVSQNLATSSIPNLHNQSEKTPPRSDLSPKSTGISTNINAQIVAVQAPSRTKENSPMSPSNIGKSEIKQEIEDIKPDIDNFENCESNSNSECGGKNVNNDLVKIEPKTEQMDIDNPSQHKLSDTDSHIKEEEETSGNSLKTEIKPVIPEPIQSASSDKKKKCSFKPEELRQALMPTLERLYRQDPESIPFRQPVDPQTLGIPDYFDIVKKPMDLSSIKNKLVQGKYSDPWEYVDDVWLMFDNAWLYNRKTSRVYRYCTKLSEVFEQEIDPVMQALGYCCGRKYTFNPQVLCCYGKQLCTIPRDAKYYSYQNRYTFCQKCFNEIPGDTVTLGDDPLQSQTQIKKDQFKEMKNDHLEVEPFVDCLDCGRKQHQICVLYLEQIWPGGFVCDNCLKKKGVKRKENKFNAKRLPVSKLGIYIETRVNNFLKKKEAGAGEVHIRVVSSSDKVVEVKPGMKSRFVDNNEMVSDFPYRAKALFAFEEVDGIDVCFFGMHVQEYGSESPAPNTRRVYIAYLDSVHFFRPKQYRTAVYHEILLGYMDYAKQLGYTMAHIWACPPSEGDDYIFHCHPPEQKIPKPKRLQEWYKKMLDKGMIERIIQDYKDILKQAIEDKLTSATELPYFEGDFWPNVLEESIKELDQEEEEKRKQAEAAEAANTLSLNEDSDISADGKKKGQKKAKKSNKSKAAQRKNSKKSNDQNNGNDLSAKIFATMEKHKEVFFVIRLHSAQSAASLAPIQDPDPLINCDLMDGRDAFLTLARDKHFEFSSLRRAQFSTLCMLYELHNQGQDKFVYTCNNCKNHVETRYHCTVCDDFDLCLGCKEKVGHPHTMEKLGFDLDDGSSPGDGTTKTNPQEARKQSIQRCIQSLVHACQCRDANCRLPSCQKMKRVVQHTKNCKRKTHGGCPICKQLIALCCYHAKHCQEAKCLVPFCPNIKQKLKQQQLQQRLQQAQLLRRRVAMMNTRVSNASSSMSSTASALPSTGNANAPNVSPVQPIQSPSMGNLGSPHQQTNLSGKPGTQTPPANVLQVVKQVQEEAARQQSIPHTGGFGKNNSAQSGKMPPPQMQRQVPPHMGQAPNNLSQQVQPNMVQQVPGNVQTNLLPMGEWGGQRFPTTSGSQGQNIRPNNPMQMMQNNQITQPGVMIGPNGQSMLGIRQQTNMINQSVQQGGASNTPPKQALQQLMQTLKNPSSGPEQQNQILQILKANPQLMAAFIKQRQATQNSQQQGLKVQNLPQQQQQQQQQTQQQPTHNAGQIMMNQPNQMQIQTLQGQLQQPSRMQMPVQVMGNAGGSIQTNIQLPAQSQQQPPQQQHNWYEQQPQMAMRLMHMHKPNYQQQRPRMPQMGNYQNLYPNDNQYSLGPSVKTSNNMLPGQLSTNINVMGPPTSQQIMQSVRSPPPTRSPQPQPSPRPTNSPRAGPGASPRAQPSPHHLSSHSPVPDVHGHLHHHQSPGNDPMVLTNEIPGLNAQDQLTKFVEQL